MCLKQAFALGVLEQSSQGALQVGFLKHLETCTVLLDLVCLSLFCIFMSFQTDCNIYIYIYYIMFIIYNYSNIEILLILWI